MTTPLVDFTKSYGQLFSGFLALSGLLAIVFFGAVLSVDYGPAKANEVSEVHEISSITYGFTAETARAEKPQDMEGRSCFLTLENGKVITQPILNCDFAAGEDVSILVSPDSSRLDPRYGSSAIFFLQLYMILGLALTIGGIFGFILFTLKKNEEQKVEENVFQL